MLAMRSWLMLVVACGSSTPATHEPPPSPPAGPQHELILRVAGKDIGHEQFSLARSGDHLLVTGKGTTTFKSPLTIDLAMDVDPAKWSVQQVDLHVEAAGATCTYHERMQPNDVAEVEVEFADGTRKLVEHESRDHAGWYISLRPTITHGALCAIANQDKHAMDSFPPWYVVRIAPRTPSTIPTSDGKRMLDLVKVDDLIDDYCDGTDLAIVHYPAHGFIAARTDYDAVAQKLAASDPTGELWAGELACPPHP